MTRWCPKCKQNLSESVFVKNTSYCHTCNSERAKAYRGGYRSGSWPIKQSIQRTDTEPSPIEGCRWISLGNNLFTLVDTDKYDDLMQWNWHARITKWTTYVSRHRNKQDPPGSTLVHMHRYLLNASDKFEVDHINHNGLDNRLENLRLATRVQNLHNTKKRKSALSDFKGVTKYRKRWDASIIVDHKDLYLGRYNSQEEAAAAYNESAILIQNEFAVLNNVPKISWPSPNSTIKVPPRHCLWCWKSTHDLYKSAKRHENCSHHVWSKYTPLNITPFGRQWFDRLSTLQWADQPAILVATELFDIPLPNEEDEISWIAARIWISIGICDHCGYSRAFPFNTTCGRPICRTLDFLIKNNIELYQKVLQHLTV